MKQNELIELIPKLEYNYNIKYPCYMQYKMGGVNLFVYCPNNIDYLCIEDYSTEIEGYDWTGTWHKNCFLNTYAKEIIDKQEIQRLERKRKLLQLT